MVGGIAPRVNQVVCIFSRPGSIVRNPRKMQVRPSDYPTVNSMETLRHFTAQMHYCLG